MKEIIAHWNRKLEHEFSNLAAKLALDENLTKNEQHRFHLLEQKRRQLKNPPSIEEHLREIENEKNIKDALNEIKKYIHSLQSNAVSIEQA
jgi:hypothetical protein